MEGKRSIGPCRLLERLAFTLYFRSHRRVLDRGATQSLWLPLKVQCWGPTAEAGRVRIWFEGQANRIADVGSGRKESRVTDVSALRNRKDGAFFPTNLPLLTSSPWCHTMAYGSLFSEEILCLLECPSCSLHSLFLSLQCQMLPLPLAVFSQYAPRNSGNSDEEEEFVACNRI